MDALISLIAAPAAAEALKTWGAFAICLLLLGGLCWILWGRLRQRETEIRTLRAESATEAEKLRAEVTRLQDLRLSDAQKMISVARSGTETMAARAEGDVRMQEMILAITQAITRASLVGTMPMLQAPFSIEAPRSP